MENTQQSTAEEQDQKLDDAQNQDQQKPSDQPDPDYVFYEETGIFFD